MSEAKNIYQRINEVMKKVEYVKKDSTVKVSATGSYMAASHDSVTALVRKHMVENGIVLTVKQVKGELSEREIIGNAPAKGRMYHGWYGVKFTNIDKPDDYLVVDVNSEALDNGDKAPGKAMSYATKYAILKTFMIETGENEESRAFDAQNELISATELLELHDLLKQADKTQEYLIEYLNKKGANIISLDQLIESTYQYSKSLLQNAIEKEAKNED